MEGGVLLEPNEKAREPGTRPYFGINIFNKLM